MRYLENIANTTAKVELILIEIKDKTYSIQAKTSMFKDIENIFITIKQDTSFIKEILKE